jgi:ABC-type phosphate/phosphonate transport system substrate-binding protein
VLFHRFKDEPLRVLRVSDPVPNFAFAASPALQPRVRSLFTKALLKLKPLSNPGDAETVKDWDDEIKNGFIRPGKAYLPSVLHLLTITQEILHEDR